MKTVKYGSRIKGRFYLILFIRLELDKILKSGNKASEISIRKSHLILLEMDCCYDRHDHKYLITYNGTRTSSITSQWMVREYCYQNKKIFNASEQVESVAILA